MIAEPSRQDLLTMFDEQMDQLGTSDKRRRLQRRVMPAVLDWLEAAAGDTWQARWEATGADSVENWIELVPDVIPSHKHAVARCLHLLLAHRLIRPSYPWLFRQPEGHSCRNV